MNWFRSNIRHGSRLALLALAIQFALSFGHFHGLVAQAAPAIQQTSQQAPSNQDSDQPADPCAICAVMALANAALFATPPVLLLPQAVEFLYLTTDAEFVHLGTSRVAFQPRGPPAS
ncbi:MAG: hypothetical protein QOJ84_3005 [Bradyrhizobium sp.]|jgi:hypothetical protein|nr:hypothetical protein [Bradyrhizobium sp.]